MLQTIQSLSIPHSRLKKLLELRLILSSDLARVERFEVLEANNPVFDEPTLGVLIQDNFYFIANSQWGLVDDKGQLGPADKLADPIILKMKL